MSFRFLKGQIFSEQFTIKKKTKQNVKLAKIYIILTLVAVKTIHSEKLIKILYTLSNTVN